MSSVLFTAALFMESGAESYSETSQQILTLYIMDDAQR